MPDAKGSYSGLPQNRAEAEEEEETSDENAESENAESEASESDQEANEAEKKEGLGLEPPHQYSTPLPLIEVIMRRAGSLSRRRCDFLYPLGAGSKAGGSGAVRLEALDAPRWIASIQIVFYHFYFQNQHWNVALAWGGSWTQFFFMLSGFVLSYAEMARPPRKDNKLSLLQYVRKRLIVIYPSYLLSIVLIMFSKQDISNFEWAVLPLHLLLMQAWLPICYDGGSGYSCSAWTWNGEAWFMSVLVIYWMLLRPMTSKVRKLSLWVTCVLLLVCCLMPFIFPQCLPYEGENGSARWNVATVIIRAGPLGYVHVFLAGILCARIFILTSMRSDPTTGRLALQVERAPLLFKFGCCVGYAIYFALVATVRLIDPFYSFAHNGGLIPIMGLVLLGAAVGVDPLTKWIFRSLPLLILGRLSYVQYLMQRIVWNFMMLHFPEQSVVAAYIPALITWAYFCQRWVESPYTEWQKSIMEKGERGFVEKIIRFVDRQAETTRLRRIVVASLMVFLLVVTPLMIVYSSPTKSASETSS